MEYVQGRKLDGDDDDVDDDNSDDGDGDYDGDGETDPCVYEETTGQWRALMSSRGYIEESWTVGGAGYMALRAGDYDGDGKLEDDEKGTLICVNHKTLQKFSNDPEGWQLSVSVTGTPASGFGYFGLADFISMMPMGGFVTNSLPSGPHVVASGDGPTGGWLDDLIVEGFWFDGSELDGTYTIDVTFTLAGL